MEYLDREQLGELDKESLIAIIVELREMVAKQGTQIQELRDQLAKNSQNSSKPPSSDGLKKPHTRNTRQKGKRRSGGQPGHQGHTLEMAAEPEHIVRHTVEVCPHCKTDLQDIEPVQVEKRQVFDLPPVKIAVTEHQVESKRCPHCGHEVKGRFPDEVSQPVQYGPRIKAQAVYLNNYQLIPLARVCELFEDFYGHAPSEAFILQANASFLEQTRPTVEAIKEQLKDAAVVHFDESGVRVEGRLNWLHVAGTDQLTYYFVHPKRGQEAMRDMTILPGFQGRALHDHWHSYLQFENCQHAFCNAHHLRELQFILDQYDQPWAQDMIGLLLDIKVEVDAAPPAWGALPPERVTHFEGRYDAILQQGFKVNPLPEHPPPKKRGRQKQTPPRNLLDRLHRHQAETLAFMHDFRIPFDNNLAERDLRMIKVKQKISGAFRTRSGANTFCAIRSYISTARKQGGHVIKAIHNAFSGQPFMPFALDGLPE
jgi:transposase